MPEVTGASEPKPEPVTAEAIRPVSRPLLTMQWRDLAFLHWPVDTGAAARLMPPGTRPDLFHGVSYAGVIAFRMHDVGVPGLPALPYLGSFPETNVRLYSVGPDGRRGVVFCSLDAARLLPALLGRAAVRLPYQWSAMRVRRRGDVISYASRRRWPRPGARLQLALRVGKQLDRPSDLEHFLTARWGLHTVWYGGRVRYLPNEHPPWPLHAATLVCLEENLLVTAGLPPPTRAPASVLYSPGVAVRMGAPDQALGGGRLDPAHRLRDLAEAVSARLGRPAVPARRELPLAPLLNEALRVHCAVRGRPPGIRGGPAAAGPSHRRHRALAPAPPLRQRDRLDQPRRELTSALLRDCGS